MKVSIYNNGKEIGTVAAENVKLEVENDQIRNGHSAVLLTYTKSRTIYAKFDDITFNDNVSLNPLDTYQFSVSQFKLPKGLRKPKRKRILNKYKKKYTYTGTWEHCQIRF